MADEIRRLIAADQVEKALAVLLQNADTSPEVRDELLVHQAELARIRRQSRRGLISPDDEGRARTRVRYAVLELLPGGSMDPSGESGRHASEGASGPTDSSPRAPSVFISYNHGDAEVADRIRRALDQAEIEVRIDRSAMRAGEDIEGFVRDSVAKTDVTLAIVSQRSLLSAWVALEAATTAAHEQVSGQRRFIACYIEDDFLRQDFLIEATDRIDARIAEIDALLPEYASRKIDTVDLNEEKSRLFNLRNNLGSFLKRLRGSLTLDIRGERFEESVSRIVDTLRS